MKKIGIKGIVVGYDYTFGHNREGNIDLLKKMGVDLGFSVTMLGQVKVEDMFVSSTFIRKLVQDGNLTDAKKLLGRNYQICGTVVKGKNRGARLLGFPTANLKVIDDLTPKTGVYAVTVFIKDKSCYGVTNIGYNPTFGNGVFSVEVHVLDFSGDLLTKTIRVNFIKRLREEKTFKSADALSKQIGLDIAQARELFNLCS